MDRLCLTILKVAASCTLIARGWLTYRFDHPVRGVFWDEDLMTALFKVDWSQYHATSDRWITPFIDGLGIVFIALGIVPWLIGKFPITRWLLITAAFLLFGDAVCRFHAKDYSIAMLVEMSLQWFTPLALFMVSTGFSRWRIGLLVAAALTFTGHGWFAIGFAPVPGNFIGMTMQLLRCSEEFALIFLKIVGVLDFLAAGAVFFSGMVRFLGIVYMILWGFLTALARLITLTDSAQDLWGLDLSFFEMMVRTPHWMVPLMVYMLFYRSKPKEEPGVESLLET